MNGSNKDKTRNFRYPWKTMHKIDNMLNESYCLDFFVGNRRSSLRVRHSKVPSKNWFHSSQVKGEFGRLSFLTRPKERIRFDSCVSLSRVQEQLQASFQLNPLSRIHFSISVKRTVELTFREMQYDLTSRV